MRWPWRRRPAKGRVVFIGTSPFDVAEIVASVPTPSPVVEAYVPEPDEERVGVQLGFADGSVMTLDDDDPRAVALRGLAATLVSGESSR